MKPSSQSITGAALLVVLGLGSSPAQATNYWKNSVVTGNWSNGNNWASSFGGVDNAGVPSAGEATNIVFIDGTARTATFDASLSSVGLLSIDLTGPGTTTSTLALLGNYNLIANGIIVGGYSGAALTNGRGALAQSGGSITTNAGVDLILGFGAGSTGTYALSGGNFVNNLNEYVGFSGTGTFNHSGGSNTINASASGFFSVGQNPGSTGTYNLSGTGALSVGTHQYVGYDGTGTLNQSGGTNNSALGTNLYIANNANSTGNYMLSGGALVTRQSQYIGYSGTGTFTHTAGTNTINASATGFFSVGHNVGSTGTYNLSGTATLGAITDEYIGYSGTGTFNQTGGANTISTRLYVGNNANSTGSYNLSGNGTLSVSSDEFIGLSGTGTFTQTGGTHTANAPLHVGTLVGGLGTYTLIGGALSANGDVLIGQGATGNMSQSGGTFNHSGGTHTIAAGKILSLGVNAGSTGTYTLSGGTLVVNQSESIGVLGTGTFSHTAGSNTINASAGGFFTVGHNMNSTGTYNLSGTGTLSVSSDEYIGYDGAGTFNQSGGTNSIAAGKDLVLGLNVGSTGTYALSGGALVVNRSEFVGVYGGGTFNHTAGSNTINASGGFFSIAEELNSTGTYNLSGSGILTSNVEESVGTSGTGTFNQSGGTNIIAIGRNLIVGRYANSTGTYNQTGGTNTVGAELRIGEFVGATGAYTLSAGSLSASSIEFVGYFGTGTFNQSGGTHNANALLVGYGTASNGTYTLSGGSATFSNSVSVGRSNGGVGVLTVSGTSVLTVGGTLAVENSLGTSINLSEGTINAAGLSVNGVPALFNWTGGTLNLTQSVTWDSAAVSTSTSAAFGASKALGNNQTLMVTGNETLGGSGAFSLTLNSGSTHYVTGALTVNPAGTITQNTGSTLSAATITQAGGAVNGTLQNQGSFIYQSGQFNGRLLNQGIVSFGPTFTVGNGVENDATMTVAAGQTLAVNGAGLDNLGTFTLMGGTLSGIGPVLNNFGGTLQGRGTINSTFTNNGVVDVDGVLRFNGVSSTNNGIVRGSGTVIGAFANSAGGTLDLAAGDLLAISNTWTNSGLIKLAGNAVFGGGTINNAGTIQGAGTINSPIANTGVVRASGGELDLGAAGNTNAAGGLIQAATGNTVMVLQGLATNAGTIALTGGAFDNNNRALANPGIINGYGVVRTSTLTNTNKLNVGEGNMDVFGNVTNNGTIGIQGGRSIYFFGNVSGSGGYTGTGTAVFLAAVSPGSSPAAVSFGGNATLTATSTLDIELGGNIRGSEFDAILANGNLSVGGILAVRLIDLGAGLFAPDSGDSFDILDWGSLTGTFSAIQLPTLAGALAWNTSQLYTTGVLSVVAPGVPGDYNNNNVVDAADYVVWRKFNNTMTTLPNDSTPGTSPADYTVWRSQFGQSPASGSGASANAAVPEPATAVMLIIGILALLVRRQASVS